MKLPRRRVIIVVAAVAAIVIGAANYFSRPACRLLTGNDLLQIPSSAVGPGEVKFFCYRDQAGQGLRFVLARGSDGKVRSVMDACAQCYKFHKGFSASKGFLICRRCGNRYPVNHILAGKASCVPIALPSQEQGGQIVVRTSALKERAWLF